MPNSNKIMTFIRRQPRWRLALLLVVPIIGGVLWFKDGRSSQIEAPTFAARRGALDITVVEGGSMQALESQEIKCEVRVGYQGTKILKIVEEGYLVTEEDVKEGKVLVELDSSDLQKQIVQQEIQYQSAIASLTDAQQNYEIQLGQNQSDINAAEQKVRFARMDFDKFLGDTITPQIVREAGLDALLAAASTNNVEETLNAEMVSAKNPPARPMPAGGGTAPPVDALAAGLPANVQIVRLAGAPSGGRGIAEAAALPMVSGPPADAGTDDAEGGMEMPAMIPVDFSKYASLDALGDGEAKQKLRKFEDDLKVARKELEQAITTLEGTQRLFTNGFAPRTDVTRDEISHESARLKVQTADTAMDLFLKYEFPKSGEEALSKYADSVRELDKARRVAISKLAQAKAKLNSAMGQHAVQTKQRSDLQEQLEKCTLRAQKSGLVVYGSGRDEPFYGNQEPIREGATVRERQAIITIPDMSRMAVNVKIHESYIKKVKKGQKARVTVDAFADQVLTGEITKVAVLPDSQNRWMNPDLKVYLTTITVEGTHEWLKPGMSAKVEILVNRLADVVYVPMQAVSPEGGKQVCYVANGAAPERRAVEVGEFTDEFIEIKGGIKEGELVLLRPPVQLLQPQSPAGSPEEPGKEEDSAPKQPAPATVPPATTAKTAQAN